MAYVLKRHSTLQLAQNLGINVIVQTIQGNENAYLDSLVKDASKLLSCKFSRTHEKEADDLAWQLLEQAQLDPSGMLSFFAAIKTKAALRSPSLGEVPSLLSTHPTPQERIDRLEQKRQSAGKREIKTFDAEFQLLRLGLRTLLETR